MQSQLGAGVMDGKNKNVTFVENKLRNSASPLIGVTPLGTHHRDQGLYAGLA